MKKALPRPSAARSGASGKESAAGGTHGEAKDLPRPSPRWLTQLVAPILIVWTALAILTFIWQTWLGRAYGLHLLAFLAGGGFALTALFDYLWRRFSSE